MTVLGLVYTVLFNDVCKLVGSLPHGVADRALVPSQHGKLARTANCTSKS